MRTLSTMIGITAAALAAAATTAAAPTTSTFGPADALDLLKAGNQRFAEGTPEHRNTGVARIADTAEGQNPFAAVLTCADSRLPVERLFDRGVGDLFTARVAGNLAGPDVAGTLEYAVDHLGTPVIVVLGHTSCGLVAAASVDGPVSPTLLPMITAVQPAVAEARKVAPGNVVAAAVQFNVFGQITRLIEQSPAIASAVESERLLVVGAVYDLSTGRVQWLGSHPDEESIIAQAGGKSRREAATAPAVTNPFAPRPQPTSDERRRFVNVPTRP